MKGRILNYSSKDVNYNLALEQAMLQMHGKIDYPGTIRFWKNEDSVIIGRTQSLHDEVDLEYCRENNITVARRITGGGTVFHDLGNLNISIFLPVNKIPTKKNVVKFTNFFTDLLIQSLMELDLTELSREGHSNIFYRSKKISGSAGYLREGWYLHHATILFNADLKHLEKSLLARESYPSDSRKSRYFPTTNLEDIDIVQLKNSFVNSMSCEVGVEFEENSIEDIEIELATKLYEKMYITKSWLHDKKRKIIK